MPLLAITLPIAYVALVFGIVGWWSELKRPEREYEKYGPTFKQRRSR